MGRRTATAVLLTALLLALDVDRALATDRYVETDGSDAGANDCTQSDDPCLTITHAIGPAVDGDTIHIGLGEYDEALSVGERLFFVGQGAYDPDNPNPQETTDIEAAGNAPGLRMRGGGGVRNLTVTGDSGAGIATDAIQLGTSAGPTAPLAYELANVSAFGGVNTSGGNGGTGLQVSDESNLGRQIDVTVSDSKFRVEKFATLVEAIGLNVSLSLLRSEIVPFAADNEVALRVDDGASVLLSESRVRMAPGFIEAGVTVSDSSHLRIERSTVLTGGVALVVSSLSSPQHSSAEVIDSVVANVSNGGSSAVNMVAHFGGTSSLLAEGATIVRRSGQAGTHSGISLTTNDGTASVDAHNSVFWARNAGGNAYDVNLTPSGGLAKFVAANSAYASLNLGATEGIEATPAGSGTNTTAEPMFVDPVNANLALQPGSPLIDSGDPALGAPGRLDLAGTPRSLDGNGDCAAAPDIGAYELTGFAAVCPAIAGASDTKGSKARLSRRALRLDRRGRAPVLVTCDAAEPDPCAGLLTLTTRLPAGTAQRRRRARTVTLGSRSFRIAPGKRAKVLVKLSRRNRARLRRLKRMRVRAALAMRDPAGNASSAGATFTLKPRAVRKRRRR